MSDEPPPLRLKPRLKPDEPAGETPPAEPSSASAAPAADTPRLKPRLKPDDETTPAPAESVPPATEEAPADRPRLKPRLVVEPEPQPAAPEKAEAAPAAPVPPPAAAGDAPPKFKLKPERDTVSPIPTAAPFSANPAEAPAPPPVEGAAADEAAPKLKLKVAAPVPPPGGSALPLPVSGDGKGKKGKGGRKGVLVAVLGVVVLLAGGFAYLFLFSGSSEPEIAARPAATPAPAAAPSQANPVSQPVSGTSETATVAPSGNIAEPTAPGTGPAVTSSAPSVETSRAEVEVAPGVFASAAPVATTPDASPAFRSWVAGATISGVFQGSNPRAQINGRVVSQGQVIDEALGIVFDGINADAREIRFRDGSGATVSRPYF